VELTELTGWTCLLLWSVGCIAVFSFVRLSGVVD